jgi:hypothetical protein
MYFATGRSQREEYQGVISRKDADVGRWMNRNLNGTESYRIELTHNGLGMRVFLRSTRAKELLSRLHRDVLPTFTEPEPKLVNLAEWSAWFGFSEPLESPHYVRVNQNFNSPLR